MAATIFDHPGFLLLIVFVALVRWLASKAKQAQNQQTPSAPPSAPPSQPIPRGGDSQTEEERMRRFLEALGQPPGTTPPKVAPRQREVRPKIFPQLPPLTTAPPPLVTAPRPVRGMPPPLPVAATTWKMPSAPGPAFEVHDVTRQSSSEPSLEIRRTARISFDPRIKLGSPADLRTAIVLREIFGPPRSLQPPDLSGAV
ncbi:MAG TPA: hypothetical protein VH188_02380 [Chthoniobacterales bacterium]|jgi:hypothetical protein|nr:hypothetical protein [Chthoniobacterales bacterium]